MSKQKEIKHWFCKYLAQFNGQLDYNSLPRHRKDSYRLMVEEDIMPYLHSQGCVLKVDEELPYRQEEIDIEILDLVNALNLGGIPTMGSCSGHGKEHGYIILKDERTLIILPTPLDKDYITRELQFSQSIKLKRRNI